MLVLVVALSLLVLLLVALVLRERAALRRSEGHLHRFYDALGFGVVVQDAQGTITHANGAACEILGLTYEQLTGRTSADPHWRITLEDGTPDPPENHPVSRARLSGKPVRGVVQGVYSGSHNERWILTDAVPLFHPDTGALEEAVVSFVDISDRKRIERERTTLFDLERNTRLEAEEARARLAFLAEASHLLTVSLDYGTTGRTVADLCVPALADWCAIEMLDEGRLKMVALAHRDPARKDLGWLLRERYPIDLTATNGASGVLRSGEPEFLADITADTLQAVARDEAHLALLNEIGFCSMMMLPLKARQNTLGVMTLVISKGERRYNRDDLAFAQELAARVAVAFDNARLYREAQRLNSDLERRVGERTAQLEATNKELESFSYSVSHDLRAPLRGIDGFSQALLEDYGAALDETAHDYIFRIRKGATRMAELIEDLLSLSRVSRSTLRPERVDLSVIARGVLEGLAADEPQRRTQFEVQEGVVAAADRGLLTIVLENLLGNAWKFTGRCEETRIAFGTTAEDSSVYFVRDNGAGFSMEYSERLFAAFSRLHSAKDFEGTGIGLATVQRIIHRHGGRIWAQGTEGAGATFYFSLGSPQGVTGAHAEDMIERPSSS